jgi:GcrA cell cycle regulator
MEFEGKDGHDRPVYNVWTEARERELAAYWGQGLTCSQIAARMGVGFTRNTIIGKVHRMKLPARGVRGRHWEKPRIIQEPGEPKVRKQPQTPSMPVVVRSNGSPEPARCIYAPKPIQPAPDSQSQPRGACAAIAALRNGQCKWPIGDPPAEDFHFCGAPVAEARCDREEIYCEYHRERSIDAERARRPRRVLPGFQTNARRFAKV